MPLETFADGETYLSVRTKLNNNTDKLDGRGEYSDSTDQKPASTTPAPITFNTNDLSSATITHSTTVNPEEFTLDHSYRYSFILGAQVERTVQGGGVEDVFVWAQLDTGSGFADVPNSAVKFELDGEQSLVLVLNYIHDAAAGDKVRFMQKVTNSTKGMGLVADVAGVDYPAVPSAILTVF